MRKLASLVIGACFLLNNVSFALSPPLIFGDFAEDNHEYKFYIIAKVGLQDYLKSVDKFTRIANSRDEKLIKKAFGKHDRFSKNETYFAETTIYDPATIHIGSEEISQVGEKSPIFMIPVFVEKNSQREDYRLLFSTIKDTNNGYPTALCTLKEFNEIEDQVKTRKVLPQRNVKSAEKLAEIKYGYSIQNENRIDAFLRKFIKKGEFTEFRDRAENVLGWDEDTYPGRVTPEKYLAEAHSDYVKSKLNDFLSRVDTNFDTTFRNKNIVLIRVPDGTDFPIIREEEKNLEVTSHSSEHAVYVLLKETDYDQLMEEPNTTDNVGEILEKIVEDMAHEAGVIYRSPWILAQTEDNNNWKFSNALDVLYSWREMFTNGETHGMAKMMYDNILQEVKSTVAKGPANLDHLVSRGINREYAATKSCPLDPDTITQIAQLVKDSSSLSETTDEFLKQAEWEPKLGTETYKLLTESAKALPHKFNYNCAHAETFFTTAHTFSQKLFSIKGTNEKSILIAEQIDLDYIHCFFKTLFEKCDCNLELVHYSSDFLPKNWAEIFNNPPEKADEVLRVIVTPKKQSESYKEFIINVALGGETKSADKYIFIEAVSGKKHGLEPVTAKIKINISGTKQDLIKLENQLCEVLDKSAPKWVDDYLTSELNGFTRFLDLDTNAFIFSEEVTFTGGVGRLLPRLAKAGIKIAVIAKKNEHRTTIDYLNAVELENVDNKIVCCPDVATVTTTIKGIQSFSYFKTESDAEEFLPGNVHIMEDLTVRQIIESLGKACGFVDEEMEKIDTAAEIFAKAV